VAKAHPPTDLTWNERIPALILLGSLLFIGFWPKSISRPINDTLTATYAPAAPGAK